MDGQQGMAVNEGPKGATAFSDEGMAAHHEQRNRQELNQPATTGDPSGVHLDGSGQSERAQASLQGDVMKGRVAESHC